MIQVKQIDYILKEFKNIHVAAVNALRIFLLSAIVLLVAAMMIYPQNGADAYSNLSTVRLSIYLSQTAMVLAAEGVAAMLIGDIMLRKG